MSSRRQLLLSAAAFLATPALAAGPAVSVYKAWGCLCCDGWIAAMRKAGFTATVTVVEDLSREWRKRGVPDQLSSCHMGLTGNYVIVGHVPPADVKRLLRERPAAIGLSVPGMPDGSPGMERPDGRREAYDTVLLLPGGRVRVYSHHPAA